MYFLSTKEESARQLKQGSYFEAPAGTVTIYLCSFHHHHHP